MPLDHQKIRREEMRWMILLTLYNASPIGAYEELVVSTVRAVFPDTTELEVRRHLDYLATRKLVELRKEPCNRWFALLARYGTDVVEYTVDCEPGIARPVKYWSN